MMPMRRRIPLVLGLLTAACAAPGPPGPVLPPALPPFAPDLAPLEQALAARVAAEPGDYGIVVLDVQTGRVAAVNESMPMPAAGTINVPVLYDLYRRASAGELSADDLAEVRDRFRSVDTSWYSLAGADRVRALMTRLGATGVEVRRGVEDGPALRAGLDNGTDAAGLARVLASLARCELLSRDLCADAVAALAQQEFHDLLPRGLPPGTRFAHTTGSIAGIRNDAGIVYPADAPPFAIVLLTRNPTDSAAPGRVAEDVARLAWQALGDGGTLRPRWSPALRESLALHERYRVPDFVERRLTHQELWSVLQPIIRRGGYDVAELGASAEGRPLRLIRVGAGPVPVLLWSQMHGDETTATRALADLLNYLASEPQAERVRRWRERLQLLVLPMLNPDGAERNIRRNAFGIDVNRDARLLATPEAKVLKAVQERYRPRYGFNLHDQNPRTRVGASERLASISLLAPPPDGSGRPVEQWQRAQRLISYFGPRIEPLVAGHITRYDDSFNPRAFGDLLSSWGVSTVLIESGGWGADPVKRWLRAVNFAALVEALDAIALDAGADADVRWYRALPENGRAVNDLVIRNGRIALAGQAPYAADLVLDLAGADYQLVDAGDLDGTAARDTLDATGLLIQPCDPADAPLPALLLGAAARLRLVRATSDSIPVWELAAGRLIRRSR